MYERPTTSIQASTLPARFYTDPEHFRREMAAIHHSMWIWAGRSEQIPEAGGFFTRQWGGDASVIVVRGDDGGIRAFHNVCRHRGTRLCAEPEGRLPGRIQCAYHAWTYGLDGTLRVAPHMEKVEGFALVDYPLGRVAVDTWDGHIFVNLAEQPPPLEQHLAGLPQKFAPWGMADLRMVERRVYQLQANWKLIIHNYSECLHCPAVHPLLHRQSHYLSGDNEPPQPTYLGGRMDLRDGVQTMSMDGTTNRRCLPGLGKDDQRRVYYYALLPNLLLNLHPDYMLTFSMWPQAVDRTDIICEWYFHPDEIGKPDFDPSGAVEFWEMTNQQDWGLSNLAQQGIGSRGYRPGPYSNREELLHGFDLFVRQRVEELGT